MEYVWIGLGVLAALVLLLVIAAATRPTEYQVQRSASMGAAPAAVFEQVNDFHNWDAWSPWAKLDPAVKNTFEGPAAGTGSVFKWNGNSKVGEGMMTILESKPSELVRIKLQFIRPFAGLCDTVFLFQPEGPGTKVTWTMTGRHSFIGKVFCLFMNMDKMLGGSFEQGLASMRAAAEKAPRI